MKTRFTLISALSIWFVFVAAFLLGGSQRALASTNITVTTTQDVRNGNDGLCSLREAVIAANTDAASGGAAGECPAGSGADTINLPAGTYGLSISGVDENNGLTGDLDIRNNLTLIGIGLEQTIINGAQIDRVLDISGNITVNITALTIQNGSTVSSNESNKCGSGLRSQGAIVVVDQSRVRNNISPNCSGGVANLAGSLSLIDSLVVSNTTQAGSGGGIINSGVLDITRTTIAFNRAPGLPNSWSYGLGGGITSYSGALRVDQSVISNNTSMFGGGIWTLNTSVSIQNSDVLSNVGGGLMFGNGDVTITESRIVNNAFVEQVSTDSAGAGIHNNGVNLRLIRTQVLSNTTVFGGGGGIFSNGPSTILIDSVVANNASVLGGGGISLYNSIVNFTNNLLIINSTVSNNINGGVVLAGENARAELINTNINSNTNGGFIAGQSAVVTITNGSYSKNTGPGISGLSSVFTITKALISENSAFDGGGIYVALGSLSLRASLVVSNTASNSGGGLFLAGTNYALENTSISGNTTKGHGGGIYLTGYGAVKFNNVTITNNTADVDGLGGGDGGGIASDSSGPPFGGLQMANTILAKNFDGSGEFAECSYSTILSLGYNWFGNTGNCSFTPATGDQAGTLGSPLNPQLASLANNGGPTLTHALLLGSPAIDAGDPAGCKDANGAPLLSDQRGYPRMIDGNNDTVARCDIGAYEFWMPTSWLYLPLVRR